MSKQTHAKNAYTVPEISVIRNVNDFLSLSNEDYRENEGEWD